MNWVDWVGYGAAAMVAASFLFRSIVRLRLVNLAGALVFTVYGVAINSVPLIITNLLIMGVHAVYLLRMRGKDSAFDILEVHSSESAFYARFLQHYRTDIHRFFPGFDPDAIKNPVSLFILADMRPVGLFVCEPEGDALRVHVDYVIPEFRDLRVARHLYSTWHPSGHYRELVTKTEVPGHQRYLKRMGFSPDPDRGVDSFVRAIAAEMPSVESAVDLPTVDPEV